MIPTSIAELKAYLASSETLIVNLNTTYDFTDAEGYNTTTGCWYSECTDSNAGQKALPLYNACSGKTSTSVTYSVAGSRTLELLVASNKTVRSTNGLGVIKGKGLRLTGSSNVIIRDITISDINPQVIWGGDAIVFNKATNIWIHKCTIRNIGRQHLVSYVQENTGITVSSCLFDGTTDYSAYCDGTHYWLWLFWGTRDEVTLINNRVVNVSGRTPHAGGESSSDKSLIHLVGNEMDTNPHLGIQPREGGYILAEGNKFINYSNPVAASATGGYLAMVNTAAQAAACSSYFGESCTANAFESTTAPTRWDLTVLNQFQFLDRAAVNGARAAVCEV